MCPVLSAKSDKEHTVMWRTPAKDRPKAWPTFSKSQCSSTFTISITLYSDNF
jgi:hypothetical protein